MPVRSASFSISPRRRFSLRRSIFVLGIIVITGFVPGGASSTAQSCRPRNPEFNVTLHAGIASGNFWNLGRAKDTVHCGQLCCQHHTCNLALSVDDFCYNVECFSDESCRLTRGNFTKHQVAVTMVTRSSINSLQAVKMLNVANRKKTSNRDITGDFPNFTPIEMLSQETPAQVQQNATGDVVFTTRKQNSSEMAVAHSHFTNNEPLEKRPRNRTRIEFASPFFTSYKSDDNGTGFEFRNSFSTKAAISLESKLEEDKRLSSHGNSTGTCRARRILHKVTLRSGLKSGDFSDYGEVPGMDACVKHCCEQPKCEVSLLLNHHCYTLHCYKPALCKIIPARESTFEPQLAFVTRSSEKDKTNTRIKKKTASSESAACAHGAIFSDVTLKGGQKAGKFILLAGRGDMQSCVKKCCANPSCQVAWLLGQHCYSVACYDKCITVKRRSDGVRSQLTLLSRKPLQAGNYRRQNIPGSRSSIDKVYTVYLNVTSQRFTEPLKDLESLEFLNLAEKIQVAVSSVFANVPSYKGAEVISFRPEPLIAKLSLTTSADTPVTKLLHLLVDAVKTGQLSSSIDGNPISYAVSDKGFQFLSSDGISLTCSPEHDYDINWKTTAFNSTENQICPRKAQGQVNRFCTGNQQMNASWSVPDFSECVSSNYRDLHEQTKGLAEKAGKNLAHPQETAIDILSRLERLIFLDTYREDLLNISLSKEQRNLTLVNKNKDVIPTKKHDFPQKGAETFVSDKKAAKEDKNSVPVTEIPRLSPEVMPSTGTNIQSTRNTFGSKSLKHDVLQKGKEKIVNNKKTADVGNSYNSVPVTEIPRLSPEVPRTTGANIKSTLDTFWSKRLKNKPVDTKPTVKQFKQPTSGFHIAIQAATAGRPFRASSPRVIIQSGGNPVAHENTIPIQGLHPTTFTGLKVPGERSFQNSAQNWETFARPANGPRKTLTTEAVNRLQFGNSAPARRILPPTYFSYQSRNPRLSPARPQNRYQWPGNPTWASSRVGLQENWGRMYSPPGRRRKRDVDWRSRRERRQNGGWYNNNLYPRQFNYFENRGSISRMSYRQPGSMFFQNNGNIYHSVQNQVTANPIQKNLPLSISYGRSPVTVPFSAGYHRQNVPAAGQSGAQSGNYKTQPGILSGARPIAVERWPKPTHRLQRPTLDFSKSRLNTASLMHQVKLVGNGARKPIQRIRTNHETTERVTIPNRKVKTVPKFNSRQDAFKTHSHSFDRNKEPKDEAARRNFQKALQDLKVATPHKKTQVTAIKRQNVTVPRLQRTEKHMAPMFGGDMLLSVGVLQLMQQFARLSGMKFSEKILQLFVNASSHLLDLNNRRQWSNAQQRAEVLYKRGFNVLESNSNREMMTQDTTVGSVVLELVRTVQEYAMNASYSFPFDKPLLTKNILLVVNTFGSDSADPTKPMSLPNYSDPLVANWSTGRDAIIVTPSIFDSAVEGKNVKVHLLLSQFKTVSLLVPETTGNNSGLVLNSAVISSTVEPAVTEELVPPIKIVLSVLNASLNKFQQECVAWTRHDEGKGSGEWSSKGCKLASSNETHTTCECNHMTDFAVLANTKKEKAPGDSRPSAAVPSGGPGKGRSWLGILLGILAVLLLIFIVLLLLFVWRKRKQSRDQKHTPRSRSQGPSRRSRSLSRSSSRPSRSVSSKSDGDVSPGSSHSSQFEEMIAARRRRMALDKQQKSQHPEDKDEDELLMKEKAMLFSEYHQPYHFLSKEEQERNHGKKKSGKRRDGRSAMDEDDSDV